MQFIIGLTGWSAGLVVGEPFGVSLKLYKEKFSFEVKAGKSLFLNKYGLGIYADISPEINFYIYDNFMFYGAVGLLLNLNDEGFNVPGVFIPLGMEGVIRDLPLSLSIEIFPAILYMKPTFGLNFSIKWRDVYLEKPTIMEKKPKVLVKKGEKEERKRKEKDKERTVRYDREKAKYYYNLGLNEYSKGNYEKALEYFKMSLAEDPTFKKAKDAYERTKRMIGR